MSDTAAPKRLRSPPYPTLSLQRAIGRVEQLFRLERDHPVPITAAAKAWGMSPTSSGPIVTVAALKQFGLLSESTDSSEIRKVRVTNDAMRLILDKDPNSATRREALHRAFQSPKMFQEIWAKWKSDLPSDATVLSYLVLERRLSNQAPFSDQAAAELLANYRASLSFVTPEDQLTIPSPTQDDEEIETMETSTTHPGRAEMPEMPSRPPSPALAQIAKVRIAENERVVFVEEGEPNQYLKVVASGDLDEIMLDALSDYINRQKRRLKRPN
jgi:hypothetical protein